MRLSLQRRHVRQFLLYSTSALVLAFAVTALASNSPVSAETAASRTEKAVAAEKRRQAKRMYSLFDHIVRICVYVFLSAVFAGLTLGVMCADTFTLEIIAESGPAPDCRYAATVLPLRRDGHQTLCTLIISNMLCNVLIVQEFSSIFDIVYAIRTHGNASAVVDDSGSTLYNFIVSTSVIVIFAEILPMAICKSKHSLRVAAAGSIFVKVARIITYPVSAPLGKFLDWIIGTEETGQVYDRKELRKLMVVHYQQEGAQGDMPKSELDLLLAAMDFQERKVKDIMAPIDSITWVEETDVITPDFMERLWLAGRSRVPVRATHSDHFCDILVVKDLLTINVNPDEEPLTVAQVVKAKNRLFAMVGENTTLPAMMKFFQDAKTHMAMVFEELDPSNTAGTNSTEPQTPALAGTGLGPVAMFDNTSSLGVDLRSENASALQPPPDWNGGSAMRRGRRKVQLPMQLSRTVGIVTMEDVVEELLNAEIYDEYDRYEPEVSGKLGDSTTSASVPTPTEERPPTVPKADLHLTEMNVPDEPLKPPRANFYSYFTHPEARVPLTDAQVWAVAYFLNRTVKPFMMWPPGYIKLLLDDCKDGQLVAPSGRNASVDTTMALAIAADSDRRASVAERQAEGNAANTSNGSGDRGSERTPPETASEFSGFAGLESSIPRGIQRYDHARFLSQAADENFVLYSMGAPSSVFTLVLGGQVDLLVGTDKFYSRLRSFNFIGEEALTQSFYVPEFSAVVCQSARVYRISREKYDKYLSFQTMRQRLRSHLRVLHGPRSTLEFRRPEPQPDANLLSAPGRRKHAANSLSKRSTPEPAGAATARDPLLPRQGTSGTPGLGRVSSSAVLYGAVDTKGQ